MLTRLGCLSRRFSAAPAQRLALQNIRALSTSSSLLNQGSTPPVPTTTTTKERGPLTKFLYEKTGVTGSWTLGLGLAAYLVSKEYYIVNAETVVCVIMGGTVYWLIRKIGPDVGAYFDAKSQAILDLLNSSKNTKIQALEEGIETQKLHIDSMSPGLRDFLVEVLHENAAMQREEEYRQRLHVVNSEVKKMLDYHVDVETAIRKHEQQQLIKWLTAQVMETVKSKKVQEESMVQCMNELKRMSVATA